MTAPRLYAIIVIYYIAYRNIARPLWGPGAARFHRHVIQIGNLDESALFDNRLKNRRKNVEKRT